jgi:hypothetical protein
MNHTISMFCRCASLSKSVACGESRTARGGPCGNIAISLGTYWAAQTQEPLLMPKRQLSLSLSCSFPRSKDEALLAELCGCSVCNKGIH